jgi:hypothetical protein
VFVKLVEVLQMFGEDGFVVVCEEGDVTSSAGCPFINTTLYLIGSIVIMFGTVWQMELDSPP